MSRKEGYRLTNVKGENVVLREANVVEGVTLLTILPTLQIAFVSALIAHVHVGTIVGMV